jgi:7-cyano-7-deazaguanine synthase
MYDAVVIVSGGLDSTTALWQAVHQTRDVHAISFNYGQRHRKELEFAAETCRLLKVKHDIVDITSITDLISNSALTGDIDVPHGHYAEDNMAMTVVPNRNAIMANIAIGAAINDAAYELWLGIHAGDHAVYPDCRPVFVESLQDLAYVANDGFIRPGFLIKAPFIDVGKDEIVRVGAGLGVRWDLTWTCYEGGGLHCGRCGTCVERLEAFDLAGEVDPVVYADRQYYKTVTA